MSLLEGLKFCEVIKYLFVRLLQVFEELKFVRLLQVFEGLKIVRLECTCTCRVQRILCMVSNLSL